MRPLASDVLLAVFQIAMGEAVEKAISQTIRSVARSEAKKAAGKPKQNG